ncbi:unnamed protein product [Owenia fusiformis]|uniref:Uncharacterized protein n=1 Tax=Owenia fusiformis TaxID=6347 RepID=A0A8S4N282_OWEFU|nr:unnamed protein product [Owenia fusiformis]CAH1774933.1 unnamed protein product [Owenia fusiformis]
MYRYFLRTMAVSKNNIRLNLLFIFLDILFSIKGTLSTEAVERDGRSCKTSWSCGLNMCCRDPTGKTLSFDPYGFGVRSWVIPGDELKQGVCSRKLAQKGEICDSNCGCMPGFKCYRPLSFNNCCSEQTCLEADIVDYRRKFERRVWKECLDDPDCPLPGVRDRKTSTFSTLSQKSTDGGVETHSTTTAATTPIRMENAKTSSIGDNGVIQTIINVDGHGNERRDSTNNAILNKERNSFGRRVIGGGGRELPKYDASFFERRNKGIERKGFGDTMVSNKKSFVPEILDYEDNVKLHQSLMKRYYSNRQTNENAYSPKSSYSM